MAYLKESDDSFNDEESDGYQYDNYDTDRLSEESLSDEEYLEYDRYDENGERYRTWGVFPYLQRRQRRIVPYTELPPLFKVTETTFQLTPLSYPENGEKNPDPTFLESLSPVSGSPPNVFTWNVPQNMDQVSLQNIVEEQLCEQVKEEEERQMQMERMQRNRELMDQRYNRRRQGYRTNFRRNEYHAPPPPRLNEPREGRSSLLTSKPFKAVDADGFTMVQKQRRHSPPVTPSTQMSPQNRKTCAKDNTFRPSNNIPRASLSNNNTHSKRPSTPLDRLCIFPKNHKSGCAFAHSFEEWQPLTCNFPHSCKKGKKCRYWHPEMETKKQFLVRAIRMDSPYFKNTKDQYIKTYSLKI